MEKQETVQILRMFRASGDEIRMQRRAGSEADGNCRMRISELLELRRNVITALSRLPYTQKDVIWRHYVKGEQWQQIARRHCYSDRHIRNINNKGLDALGRELDTLLNHEKSPGIQLAYARSNLNNESLSSLSFNPHTHEATGFGHRNHKR